MSSWSSSTLSTADWLRAGKPIASVIAQVTVDAASIANTLANTTDPGARAALALVAGLGNHAATASALVPLLAEEGFPARAASWALARIGGPDIERTVLDLISTGKLDQRENGYWCLTTMAALGKASPALADAAVACIDAENAKARSGGSALADHACRLLAVLGDKRSDEKAQEAMNADRFCDRFELNRLRKLAADGRRDQDTIAERSADWTVLFADQLAPPEKPVEVEKPAVKPTSKLMTNPAAPKAPGMSSKAGPTAQFSDAPPSYDQGSPYGADTVAGATDVHGDDAFAAESGAEGLEGEIPPESKAGPVDWVAFVQSPEYAELPDKSKQLAEQLGKVLEQLAARAVGVPLADLAGQEFLALLLQVLPQAMPPQHVQAALSPQALHGYQALAKFLARTGAATHGSQLVDAVKVVRKQLQEQIRRSGMLGGPDYSDPDDKKPAI